MKKYIVVILITVMSLLLSGCGVATISVENMLVPPKLTGELSEIYKVFARSVDKNVKLKYPRQGEHKSAITLVNLDGEESSEAIVFYEIPSTSAENYTLRVNVLDKVDDEWVTAYNLGVEAVGVDKFNVVTVGDSTFAIIGFTSIGSSKSIVKIYSYSNRQLIERSTHSCSTHEIIDINGDGKDELILFGSRTTEDQTENYAVSVNLSSGKFEKSNPVLLDSNVQEYIAISKGHVMMRPGSVVVSALYIDGVKGTGVVSTQILTGINHYLINLIYKGEDINLGLIEKTQRNARILSRDINSDQVLEIPQLFPFLGYEDTENHNKLFYTRWSNYTDNQLVLNQITYSDYSLNFMLILDEDWTNKITATKNSAESAVTFYSYTSKNKKNKPWFSIRMVKRNEVKGGSFSDFTVIKTVGQVSYLFKLHNEHEQIPLNDEDIKQRFKLIT